MLSTGKRSSNQSDVWAGINVKLERLGVASETSAMSDIFEKEAVRLEDYVKSFSPQAEQSGSLFAIGGRVVGLELFDSADTLRKLNAKLLRSYGLDALDRSISKPSEKGTPCTPAEAEAFLKGLSEAKGEEFPAVGEGVDIRLSGQNLTGAALAVGDRVIHLCAFLKAR